jgi:hypothetical protein
VSPGVEEPIGHALHQESKRWIPTSLDASSGVELSTEGARVVGALVERGTETGSDGEATQLILPLGAKRRVLISNEPGYAEVVEAPREPPWMRTVGLACQCFEHTPRIPAAWLITEWRLRATSVRRIDWEGGDYAAGDSDPSAWVAEVLNAGGEAAEEGDREAWAEIWARAVALA